MDKSKIRRLADYAVRQCRENSENCYWSVSYDELYHHFGAEVTDSNENGKLLEEELRQREEINELIMTEDAIESLRIYICFNVYCYNVQPGINIDYATGNSSGPASENTSQAKAPAQTESTTQPPAQPGNTETVWVSATGKKYHRKSSCSNMKNPSQISKSDAINRGYEPCKKCY